MWISGGLSHPSQRSFQGQNWFTTSKKNPSWLLSGTSKVVDFPHNPFFLYDLILFSQGEPTQADLGKSDGEERVVPGERGTLPALRV